MFALSGISVWSECEMALWEMMKRLAGTENLFLCQDATGNGIQQLGTFSFAFDLVFDEVGTAQVDG